ncbi:unnamed protein product [Larinioides sclopetarius]|uniref:Uncharacterized protein n=1 Tax=Larinioides sclopetarius TaxID=280406 RepID=A0AAV1ZQL0_9ARAC
MTIYQMTSRAKRAKATTTHCAQRLGRKARCDVRTGGKNCLDRFLWPAALTWNIYPSAFSNRSHSALSNSGSCFLLLGDPIFADVLDSASSLSLSETNSFLQAISN